eukprot:gnl/Dysnectes_brevis/4560_a6181_263.p1 GENE.gnl/Dysnectes_brevis/4560_a6181_263~~gnl/Dysnectes_brevis/4560_a6181_263.p1  ORF type:complete len:718 (+),score=283.81 gnl/Dysnectes_brevis/4560_a6181_263:237-2390(+)
MFPVVKERVHPKIQSLCATPTDQQDGEIDASKTLIFSDDLSRATLSPELYSAIQDCKNDPSLRLSPDHTRSLADALLAWAECHHVTHYCHWFNSLSGQSAMSEKLCALRTFQPQTGRLARTFGADELTRTETDASSFASGGLRSTYEARGIVTLDFLTPPFIRETALGATLCVPSTFSSFRGHALDHRRPLVRSCSHLQSATEHLGRLLGPGTTGGPVSFVGPEQEYFLLRMKDSRQDIRACGRTLFGRLPHRHAHHYFSSIPADIGPFLRELDLTLAELGVGAQCHHNEVAPSQFEVACIHAEPVKAFEWNGLLKQAIETVAVKHGLKALLHPKPFAGINGSGQHINWSFNVCGRNAFKPPSGDEATGTKALFLLAIGCAVAAVDRHAGVLRAACASAANDLRLGGHEAPPAVISVFLGEDVTHVMDSLQKLESEEKQGDIQHFLEGLDLSSLSSLDTSDRNRTSPFAFTGNKFEFRMPGSDQSVAWLVTLLQSVIAEPLHEAARMLAEGEGDPVAAAVLHSSRLFQAHKRVVNNADNYSKEWRVEAARRGLPSLDDTPSALAELSKPGNIALLSAGGVLSPEELAGRQRVRLSTYCREVENEGRVLLDMVRRRVLCDAYSYMAALPAACGAVERLGKRTRRLEELSESMEVSLDEFSDLSTDFELSPISSCIETAHAALSVRKLIFGVSSAVYDVEQTTGHSFWTLPVYEEILRY